MDPVSFHLATNHFIIVGVLFGLVILGFGMFKNIESLKFTGLIILVVVALVTIPVYLSGENAEDKVEEIEGVSHDFIEEHEELALMGLWVSELTGILALIGLFMLRKKKPKANSLCYSALAGAAVCFVIMVQIGSLGGKIRHSELRDPPTPTELEDHGNDYEDDD